MTHTQIVTAGALVAAGSDLSNAAKLNFQTTTRGYTIEVRVTNGNIPSAQAMLSTELRFASSNVDAVAATQAALLSLGSITKEFKLKPGRADVTHASTKLCVPTGPTLYVWINSPKLPANATVDIWVNEIT